MQSEYSLEDEWSFWELHKELKEGIRGKQNYSNIFESLNKEIVSFGTLVEFEQIWNNSKLKSPTSLFVNIWD
jgi:hypothetical protein